MAPASSRSPRLRPTTRSITEFIRERGLLPPDEIDRIIATALTELIAFQAAQAALPLDARTPMGRWLDDFNRGADALRQEMAHA